jgi:hypothetical protein
MKYRVPDENHYICDGKTVRTIWRKTWVEKCVGYTIHGIGPGAGLHRRIVLPEAPLGPSQPNKSQPFSHVDAVLLCEGEVAK